MLIQSWSGCAIDETGDNAHDLGIVGAAPPRADATRTQSALRDAAGKTGDDGVTYPLVPSGGEVHEVQGLESSDVFALTESALIGAEGESLDAVP
jgi:hypothetical protein